MRQVCLRQGTKGTISYSRVRLEAGRPREEGDPKHQDGHGMEAGESGHHQNLGTASVLTPHPGTHLTSWLGGKTELGPRVPARCFYQISGYNA